MSGHLFDFKILDQQIVFYLQSQNIATSEKSSTFDYITADERSSSLHLHHDKINF